MTKEEILKQIRAVNFDGPTLSLISIPEALRDELLSSIDLTRAVFPDVPGDLAITCSFFSFWCGNRLHPGFRPPSKIKSFTRSEIEALDVQKAPMQPEEIKAFFKPGSYMIDLMQENQVYAPIAFGYLRDHSFELRHCDWICTSLVIGMRKLDDHYRIYTKSGSIYQADLPIEHVQLPLKKLPMLRKGLSPEQLDIIDAMEADGARFIDVIS